MAFITTRLKSAFTPSSRRSQQLPPTPPPIFTMSTPVLGLQRSDDDQDMAALSPVESLSSTAVHFAPDTIATREHGSRSGMGARGFRTKPVYSYSTYSSRSRRRDEYGHRQPQSTSAIEYIRVPAFPGTIIRKPQSWRFLGNSHPRIKGGSRMSYSTSPSKDSLQPKKDALSQGHLNDPSSLHNKDVQSQSAESRKRTRKTASGGALDAATDWGKKDMKPSDTGSGNPEGVGMVDQVGSASGSARHFEKK